MTWHDLKLDEWAKVNDDANSDGTHPAPALVVARRVLALFEHDGNVLRPTATFMELATWQAGEWGIDFPRLARYLFGEGL